MSRIRRVRRWLEHVGNRYLGSLLPAKAIVVQDECWCGIHHLGDYWHDPTHGKVDRDIQDMVAKGFPGTDRAQTFAIMLTAQSRRDRGLPI